MITQYTDEEILAHRKLWVDTLLSGKYQQGTGSLRKLGDTYCCLGVLCEVYKEQTGEGTWGEPIHTNGNTWYEFEMPNDDAVYGGVSPEKVHKWAGISRLFIDAQHQTAVGTLIIMNDALMPFGTIAEKIESFPLPTPENTDIDNDPDAYAMNSQLGYTSDV